MLKINHDDSIKNLRIYSIISGMTTVSYIEQFFGTINDYIDRDTESDDYDQQEWVKEIRKELTCIHDIRISEDLTDTEKANLVNKHIIELDKLYECTEEEYLEMVEYFEYITSDD